MDTSATKNAALGALGGLAAGVALSKVWSKLAAYQPPAVWTAPVGDVGHKFKGNSHTSGSRTATTLPMGKHDLQLYSMGTPNGVKCTILLEEINQLDPSFEYDAWLVSIMDGSVFGSGFVDVNPNSKIPCMMDHSSSPPTRLFESGSILHYVAKKLAPQFLGSDAATQAECMNWVMWQMGSGPYLGGGFGHFYAYAQVKQEYPINRFSMEAKRLLDVLDKHLEGKTFICGDEYTIADMATWPWFGNFVLGRIYGCKDFLQTESYTNVLRWAKMMLARPAVVRGRMVNRPFGNKAEQLRNRHSAADFLTNTEDKVAAREELAERA